MKPARSLGRGFTALAGLVALVVGVPLGLVALSVSALGSRSPLTGVKAPWRWSAHEISAAFGDRLTEGTLIDAIVRVCLCIVWICLAITVLTTFAELVSQLRHGVALPRVRGLTWSQRIASTMVVGLLALAPGQHGSLRVSGAALPARDSRPAVTMVLGQRDRRADTPVAETLDRGDTTTRAGWPEHQVSGGESVWDIGSRLSGGDPDSTHTIIRQILDANLGRTMSDGSVFNDPGYIEDGWLLSVPHTASAADTTNVKTPVAHAFAPQIAPSIDDEPQSPPPAADPTPPAAATDAAPSEPTAPADVSSHTIRRGDTLWAILDDHYGHVDARLVGEVATFNHLGNPSAIPIGTAVALPPLESLGSTTPSDHDPVTEADPAPGADHGTIVVRRGDTLSSIAEHEYGDPDDWTVLYAANRGKHFGGRTFDNPNLILPGWALTVPDDPTTVAPPPAPAPAFPPPTVVTTTTTTAPTTSSDAPVDPPVIVVGTAPAGTDAVGASSDGGGVVVSAPDRTAPDRTDVGDTSVPPSSSVPPSTAPVDSPTASAEPASDPEPAAVATTLPPPTGRAAPPVQVSTDVGVTAPMNDTATENTASDNTATDNTAAGDASATRPGDGGVAETGPVAIVTPQVSGSAPDRRTPLVPASALVLATGIIGLIEARRRKRLRTARHATVLPIEPDAALLEAQLRRRSQPERLSRLDLAVRAAAPAVAARGLMIGGVLLAPTGEVDLLLVGDERHGAGPAAPSDQRADDPTVPEPFVVLESGVRWRLPGIVTTEDIPVPGRFAAFPSPALAHVGTADERDIFVDIEALGVLAVVGSADRAAAVLQGIVGSLTVSPFAETVSMFSAGLSVHADALPRLINGDDVADAIGSAVAVGAATAGVLPPDATTFALRATGAGEAWEPALVALSASAIDEPSAADAFLQSVTGGRGVCVVTDHPCASAVGVLQETPDGWLIEPFGLLVHPVGLTDDQLIQLDELIAAADIELHEVPVVPIVDHDAAFEEIQWSLMVRLLGPVDVIDRKGTTAVLSKSKSLELVAWLGQHRGSSTRTGARAALWEAEIRDATFANVVSEARRALARLAEPPEGMEWIGRTMTEQLPLHPWVVTDADVLRQRLDHARACEDAEEAIFVLLPGLQLVRDVPFSGLTYIWADTEGTLSNLSLLISSAAIELAERYLELGDVDGVFWATGRGLAVLPGQEELIALRMRARGRCGDFAGVRQEWESYERVLLAESWGDGEPSPAMIALRQEVLGERTRRPSADLPA